MQDAMATMLNGVFKNNEKSYLPKKKNNVRSQQIDAFYCILNETSKV
jgi:hypothetical protein